jgi:tRNA threonylcarbamoyladenosine biosynthesis protein TsaB
MIETATAVCSVGICANGELQSLREEMKPNSHASLVAVFIDEVLKECGMKVADLDAVAVSMGPGSYTGLRIGVSSAKGICYAVSKPLIAISTLRNLAGGMISMKPASTETLFVPMIDARRMEVYMAMYDHSGQEILPVSAEIISPGFFDKYVPHNLVIAGDGAEKTIEVLNYKGTLTMLDILPSVRFMCHSVNRLYEEHAFVDTAYFEPYYLKDFVAGKPKVKGLH